MTKKEKQLAIGSKVGTMPGLVIVDKRYRLFAGAKVTMKVYDFAAQEFIQYNVLVERINEDGYMLLTLISKIK